MQVAQRGSILFFALLSVQNLDPVYTFSSDWFMEVFLYSVQAIPSPATAASKPEPQQPQQQQPQQQQHQQQQQQQQQQWGKSTDAFEAYVNEIVHHMTLTVFHRVSYGLLTKHFLPFSFKLCTMLLMHRDKTLSSPTEIRKAEWLALLHGNFSGGGSGDLAMDSQHSSKQPGSSTRRSKFKKLKPEGISYKVWEGMNRLDEGLHVFGGILMHIIHNTAKWVQFSKSQCPWLESFGDQEEVLYKGSITKSKRRSSNTKSFTFSSINRFHQIILINIFCPNQLAASVKWFIEAEMGAVYTTRVAPSLEAIYHLTNSSNPALIILTRSVMFLLYIACMLFVTCLVCLLLFCELLFVLVCLLFVVVMF